MGRRCMTTVLVVLGRHSCITVILPYQVRGRGLRTQGWGGTLKARARARVCVCVCLSS